MKISFITTVFNEQHSLGELLDSLITQSRLPDEVVIVDGGSSDQTTQLITKYGPRFLKKRIRFKLIERKGNRSVGRNTAIKNATGDIIVCSDSGCTLDKKWLENIIKPFENMMIDVVAGYYKGKAVNVFEKSLIPYVLIMPDKLDPQNFLPSSRSIAFRKSVWKKVKYPEWLDTCEDLYFARELKRKGYVFAFAKNAIVYWRQRKNILQAFRQFFSYAVGDGTARYFRKNTPFLFIRYAFAFLFIVYAVYSNSIGLTMIILLLLFMYVLWAIFKNYKYVNDLKALYYLPMLQFSADIAVLAGTIIGFFKSFAIKRVNV